MLDISDHGGSFGGTKLPKKIPATLLTNKILPGLITNVNIDTGVYGTQFLYDTYADKFTSISYNGATSSWFCQLDGKSFNVEKSFQITNNFSGNTNSLRLDTVEILDLIRNQMFMNQRAVNSSNRSVAILNATTGAVVSTIPNLSIVEMIKRSADYAIVNTRSAENSLQVVGKLDLINKTFTPMISLNSFQSVHRIDNLDKFVIYDSNASEFSLYTLDGTFLKNYKFNYPLGNGACFYIESLDVIKKIYYNNSSNPMGYFIGTYKMNDFSFVDEKRLSTDGYTKYGTQQFRNILYDVDSNQVLYYDSVNSDVFFSLFKLNSAGEIINLSTFSNTSFGNNNIDAVYYSLNINIAVAKSKYGFMAVNAAYNANNPARYFYSVKLIQPHYYLKE